MCILLRSSSVATSLLSNVQLDSPIDWSSACVYMPSNLPAHMCDKLSCGSMRGESSKHPNLAGSHADYTAHQRQPSQAATMHVQLHGCNHGLREHHPCRSTGTQSLSPQYSLRNCVLSICYLSVVLACTALNTIFVMLPLWNSNHSGVSLVYLSFIRRLLPCFQFCKRTT